MIGVRNISEGMSIGFEQVTVGIYMLCTIWALWLVCTLIIFSEHKVRKEASLNLPIY